LGRPYQICGIQLNVGEAFEERLKRDMPLESGQGGAQAEMRTQAKCDVAVVAAAKIERIGVLKLVGIPIGRPEHKEHVVVLLNVLSMQLEIDGRATEGRLNRAVVAQQLFNGTAEQRRIRLQPLPLARMAQHGQNSVADQIGRGLVSGQTAGRHTWPGALARSTGCPVRRS